MRSPARGGGDLVDGRAALGAEHLDQLCLFRAGTRCAGPGRGGSLGGSVLRVIRSRRVVGARGRVVGAFRIDADGGAAVRAFGVVVSEADADRIERTNDAISRLGLIWRGLSNQLAVAAAPALEAVADAMAAVASRTGPLGVAIRGLFDNIGRLTTYAATFAGIMVGRWVAGMAAAALSVRGLATALVVLRGALIRTGIGALIVGAGELVHQFGQLVRGAGGFGNALALMGTVASAVWDGIGTTVGSFIDDFRAMRAEIESIWLRLMGFLSQKWADFLSRIGPSFNAVSERIGPLEALWKHEAEKRCAIPTDRAKANLASGIGKCRKLRKNSRYSAIVHGSFDTAHNLKVVGSNPTPATKFLKHINGLNSECFARV